MASSTSEFKTMLIERLTLGVVKSLEKRPGVCDVITDYRSPTDASSVTRWETNNCCTLPPDLKEFYFTTDGFLLTWKVKIKDEVVPVGRMEVNSLSRLDKLCAVSTDGQVQSNTLLADLEVSEEDDPNGVYPHFDQRCRIFEVDSCQNIGKVCLVYHNTKQGVPARHANYWLLDKALRWHFITESFQSYFRLMLTNLGLPQWQYLFTDIGVTRTVQQWYNLYAPISLNTLEENIVDMNNDSVKDQLNNSIDVNRVFKGKEKKKQPVSQMNQNISQRRKLGSPQPNRNLGMRGSTSSFPTANKGAPGSYSR